MSGLPRPVRWLLRLFPEDFRRMHGESLALDCSDRVGRRGAVGRLWFWARACLDLVVSLAGVWWDRASRPYEPSGSSREGRMMGIEHVMADLRHAARGLLRSPGFALTAVGTIALGLGANAAIFSVVDGVLLEPLPYEESDELTRVWGRFLPESGFDFPYFPIDPTEYLDVRDGARSFESVAAYAGTNLTLSGIDDVAERRSGLAVTWNLFDLLGVRTALGRPLVAADDVADGPDVAVLSHDFWATRFGADPGIIGSSVMLNRVAHEVVGVLPPGFSFPSPGIDAYVPLQLGPNPSNRMSHYLRVVGRRAEGVSLERAQSEIEQMMAGWASEYPEIHTGHFLFLEGFQEAIVRPVRGTLVLLLAAVGFVLLVACANVANLLLVRGQARAGEVAVRRALGAGRGRVLRGFLMESLLIAVLGAALGLAMAKAGVPALLALDDGAVPLAHAVAIDGSVLAFTALLTIVTALVFGALPALQALGASGGGALREGARAGSSTRRRARARNVLVAGEVALSFILVVAAGLMIRSVGNLLGQDPGFDSDRRLVAGFSLPSAAYPDAGDAQRFLDEVVEAGAALPGVRSVTHASNLPMRGQSQIDFQLEGLPEPGPGQPAWNAGFNSVRAGYFEAMGIAVLDGRGFDAAVDRPEAEVSVVVSRSFADKFLEGLDPLGQRMRFGGSSEDAGWWTVVGVVDDVMQQGLGAAIPPMYYLAAEQLGEVGMAGYARFGSLVVHTVQGDPLGVAEALRRIVARVDPDVSLTGIESMDRVVASSVASSRFVMTLLGLFGFLALALGAVGIYGVTSFAVSQRRRDFGIHKALGAGGPEVVRLVMRQGLAPVALGALIGVLGAVASGRVLSSLLYGVEGSDAATYASVLAVLGAVALASVWIPARRAARLDPMASLRSE